MPRARPKLITGRAKLYFPVAGKYTRDKESEAALTYVAAMQRGHTSKPADQFSRHRCLVEFEGHVYLRELLAAETSVVERIHAIMQADKRLLVPLPPPDFLSEEQKSAYYLAFSSPISIITGIPGTGKTTVAAAIVRALTTMNVPVMVMTPTGKAAVRMREAIDNVVSPTTIHRALKWVIEDDNDDIGLPTYGRDHPWYANFIIVDECSMIDLPLMACLLDAVRDGARILFVGDPNQLSPVGPGQPFLDFIVSGIIQVARLETIFRNVAGSDIAFACKQILSGHPYKFFDVIRGSTEVFWYPEKETTMPLASFVVDNVPDAQVLSPLRETAAELNRILAPRLNVQEPNCRVLPLAFEGIGRPGDKIQQIKNNYFKEVFNGDQGILATVGPRNVVVNHVEIRGDFISFPSWPTPETEDKVVEKVVGEVNFDLANLPFFSVEAEEELTLAYALTVHRAQGSEWSKVVIDLPAKAKHFVTRRLLFTAVSRAKSAVHIFGHAEMIASAITSTRDESRRSRLAYRLRHIAHG